MRSYCWSAYSSMVRAAPRDRGPPPHRYDGIVDKRHSANATPDRAADHLRGMRGVAREERTGDPTARMKSALESSTQAVLAGLVERVTFHNAENGFCVLRAKARGHRDLVTVVGHAAIISAGEWITASGEWINDRAHGQSSRRGFSRPRRRVRSTGSRNISALG